MSHGQNLLPPPTVEETTNNVALTPYNRPESAFNFEGCEDQPHRGLASLLLCSLLEEAETPSTDSSLEAVITRLQLQFQPQRRNSQPPHEVRDPPLAM